MFRNALPVRSKKSLAEATNPLSESSKRRGTSNPDATIEPQVKRVKGLTDIPGVRVGHVSDFGALTGCTAIVIPDGAVGGVDIRGSATGTEEIATLDPGHVTDHVHGILLAGGSAFGLEAASGLRRWLERK